MRNVLIDHIKHRNSLAAGGNYERQPLDEVVAIFEETARIDSLLALNEALVDLRTKNPRQCDVVEFRFFGGMKMQEIADHLNLSLSVVENDWRLAKAKLYRRLRDSFSVD